MLASAALAQPGGFRERFCAWNAALDSTFYKGERTRQDGEHPVRDPGRESSFSAAVDNGRQGCESLDNQQILSSKQEE